MMSDRFGTCLAAVQKTLMQKEEGGKPYRQGGRPVAAAALIRVI